MTKSRKRILLIFAVCFFLGANYLLTGKELSIITLQKCDVFDFEDQLEENEVFLRSVMGFEHDGTHLYYFDNYFSKIYKVRPGNFKLVKTISSKGQGPGEIAIGVAMCHNKGKLYVIDVGYGGIKIFDTEGRFIKQFKAMGLGFGPAMTSKGLIDVNEAEEIYFRCNVAGKGELISVYDDDGIRLRGLIPVAAEKDFRSSILRNKLIFKIDHAGNVIVLFNKLGILQKYDRVGNLLWSKDILQVLPKNERNIEGIKRTRDGGISFRVNFIGLAILEDDRIFASGEKTGILLSERGKVLGLFNPPEYKGGFGMLLFWKGTRLMGLHRQYNFSKYIQQAKTGI
jgi:hypothetical protein